MKMEESEIEVVERLTSEILRNLKMDDFDLKP